MALFKASTVAVSQDIMMRLAELSDNNVRIQMHVLPSVADPTGAAEAIRFVCQKCAAIHNMKTDILLNEVKLLEEIEWCKAHRHDAHRRTATGTAALLDVPSQQAFERRLKVVK